MQCNQIIHEHCQQSSVLFAYRQIILHEICQTTEIIRKAVAVNIFC